MLAASLRQGRAFDSRVFVLVHFFFSPRLGRGILQNAERWMQNAQRQMTPKFSD